MEESDTDTASENEEKTSFKDQYTCCVVFFLKWSETKTKFLEDSIALENVFVSESRSVN